MPSSPLAALPPDLPHPQPASLADLFFSFTWLALQGFGGVLAVIQREMVERKRWLTQEQFMEDWALAQIMPGPNVINLSLMLGARYFGLRGALTALAGMLAVPLVIVLLLGVLYTHFGDNAQMAGALRGMAAVSAGMIAAMGMKLAGALGKHPLPLWLTLSITVLGVLMVAILRWPLLYILLGLGGIGCLLTYRKLSS
ncbi:MULTISPECIES: chromate transporter [unclassified Janthinobacterium]|uniref:Chromate transporter n=1 Tax=Janthinobacterium lividum TaxID=29581 RepID=A0A1E8PNK2_9BURK|nr:chromate transporter [Janthinobacterium sp. CG_23.4]MDH6158609.1 chromate transporter [Janthinobacterium sp. CG_23.4]OFJ47324.1 chromate transporter [Janthinobacterium lividum]